MGYVDKALMAHLSSGLHQYLRGNNQRAMIGLTHGDVNKHSVICAQLGIPDNSIAVLIGQIRTAGAGVLAYYPENSVFGILGASAPSSDELDCILVPLYENRLYYRLSVIDDVWDLYVFGYIVEGLVRG